MILVIYIFENLVYTGGFLGKQIGAEPGGPGRTSTRVSFKSLAPTRSPVDADWSSARDEWKRPNLLQEIIEFVSIPDFNFKG